MSRSSRRIGSLTAIAVALVFALQTPNITLADDEISDLGLLAEWMIGSFSSAVQAAEDPEFFDLSLHVAPIWTERSDGRWLYVEQAVSGYQEQPYRVRVYQLRELVPSLFETRIFTLPDTTEAVGAWLSENPLSDLGPKDLTERNGCAILLRRPDENFVGSTIASLCTSTLRGASYATSEVLITPDGMVSWDRGFDGDGRQVWGAAGGGTVFDRIVPDEEEPASGSELETSSESVVNPETDPEVE